MRKKGLEKFSYPRNPVNKEDAASTALGYLIKYLIFLISTSITRYAIHKTGISYRRIHPSDIEAVKKALNSGESIENMIENISKEVSTRITPTRSR